MGAQATETSENVVEAPVIDEPGSTTTPDESQQQQQTSGEVPFEQLPEAWQKEIKKLREENAKRRVQSKETKTEGAKSQKKDEGSAEQGASPVDPDQIAREVEERVRAQADVEKALLKAGVVDEEVARELLLRKFAPTRENGKYTDLDAKVDALKQAHPALFNTRPPGAGDARTGSQPKPGSSILDWMRSSVNTKQI